MKKYSYFVLLVAFLLGSCAKDLGNYDYNDKGNITVAGVAANIQVLNKIDRITITPTITSSSEGIIQADNPNFAFRYRIALTTSTVGQAVNWIELGNTANLDIRADFTPGNYTLWFTVTDKRTNVVSSHSYNLAINLTTHEGWLVLGNEGVQEKLRLDMISLLPTGLTPLYNVAAGLPELHHATQIGFSHNNGEVFVMSEEGAYELNPNSLESGPMSEYRLLNFLTPPADKMIASASFSTPSSYSFPNQDVLISDLGNAYVRGEAFGAMYSLAINTPVAGSEPTYRLAPFFGFSPVRPGNTSVGVFYDQQSQSFLGFNSASPYQLSPVPNPSGALFPFSNTGKSLVHMENTRLSNGLVYAILQDPAGKRSICGINMQGTGFVQESYFPNFSAPGFEQATQFAFNSRFPILFYSVGNKLYLYNLGSGVSKEIPDVDGRDITLLKFNPFKTPQPSYMRSRTPEILEQQFRLIVGTFDGSVPNGNGGKVTFYDVDGPTNSVRKQSEYSGFAKVKDVVYRER